MQAEKPANPLISHNANRRLNIWYLILIIISAIFVARLFYLQIIKHDFYRQQALAGQLKEYEIPAERGAIKIHDNGSAVPLVLNQKQYTLFADPTFINDAAAVAAELTQITKGNPNDYIKLLKTPQSRYVILAKRLGEEQKKQIESLKISGVGTQPQNYRVYPQGSLAAQLLGFVN